MECIVVMGAVAAVLQTLQIIGKSLQALRDWCEESDDISAAHTAHKTEVWKLLKEQKKLEEDYVQLPPEDQSYLHWLTVTITKDLEFLHSELKKQGRGRALSCFRAVPDMEIYMTKVDECLRRARIFIDHVGTSQAGTSQAQSIRSNVDQLRHEQSEHREILWSFTARGKLLTQKQIQKLCPYFQKTKKLLILKPGYEEEEGEVYLIEEVSMGRPTERASRRVRLCSLTFWLREVSSPYVAKIARVIETEFCFYVYSEVGDCRPLRDWLQGDQAPAGGNSKDLIRTLCEGVSYMHDNRMVHKNINSKNVLVKADGSACVLAGLIETKWMLQDSDNVENEDSQDARWRMLYESPERRVGTTALYAPACDIYSLGVVMAEIILRVSFFDEPSLESKEGVDHFVETKSVSQSLSPDAALLLEWYGKCTHHIGAMRPSVDTIMKSL
ncbi:hypothetical protein GOP47_0019140 [Adiantum capillus-veneris]|uniref:Protein kinase domain-containing protein n=1 Tax=Adiantum capillus-veneris TaxID=13818 RepID=A0A9D4UEK2_ADICA|nr:hypothetical protein GOP47_0019140 [Adiantum capillus-veneris]